MKKLIIIFLIATSFCYTQSNSIPPELYGNWYNQEQELLTIQPNNTFVRRSVEEIIAQGTIKIVDGELRIIRTDISDEYNLLFYLGETSLVITKPKSKEAWLFYRLGN